jgi:hypothetical protein
MNANSRKNHKEQGIRSPTGLAQEHDTTDQLYPSHGKIYDGQEWPGRRHSAERGQMHGNRGERELSGTTKTKRTITPQAHHTHQHTQPHNSPDPHWSTQDTKKEVEDIGHAHKQFAQELRHTKSTQPHAMAASPPHKFQHLTGSYVTPCRGEWGGLKISEQETQAKHVDSKQMY